MAEASDHGYVLHTRRIHVECKLKHISLIILLIQIYFINYFINLHTLFIYILLNISLIYIYFINYLINLHTFY
jgi:hypothetical protein